MITATDRDNTLEALLKDNVKMAETYGFSRVWLGGRSERLTPAQAALWAIGEVAACRSHADLADLAIGPCIGDDDDL